MANVIHRRLSSLRQFLEEKDLHAFIIPSTDPHLSEYPASHWASREWISGFTGSAGTIVVTRDKAGLWTDSRYFLQAAQQLNNSGIDLFREGLPTTPTIEEWLLSELSEGNNVGIDGNVYAAHDAYQLTARLNSKGLHLIADYDPFTQIWKDRPQIPTNTIFELPTKYSGVSASDKIKEVRQFLKKEGADSILISSLDTIAWLYNIRGNDVHCNPVAVCHAYVSNNEAVIFIDPKKLTQETVQHFQQEGVAIADYTKVEDYVSNITEDSKICLQSTKISFSLYNRIPKSCRIIDIPSPVDLMKSVKNETEKQGFRNAMERDGVALVKFFMWLEKAVPAGEVEELTIVEKLVEYRSQQDLFVGESFDTIAGYMPNGAIVHYHVTPESSLKVKPEGLLLIDSGAQFFDGTTDITRTVAVGTISEQMKKDYTMVLKGHINLATAIFPQGTRGSQLDILARKTLWDNGLNYLHGTGHGIGHFLNVHEGPQNIRMNENPTTLQPGMVTSNEPGLYRANQYGIRIENLILAKEECVTEFGAFYSFETLTLCPIDTAPIIKEMLTNKEISWFNNYHQFVFDRLSPSLTEEEKAWLKEKTKAI
ncbi:aminopeptidase P family protein [Dysgonomonas macrotermitis]|uniref:Xaa-Pro aminopeptidase n=1 Tax=Dysgonomonas macrotermitis TaxID=1346286 RepID=A0A1M4ZLF1_9BACT|nr:aminopeptidase P family protein [Dysgonomonas macrotermitis]SHF18910.1 Xaa-Pro aminopeptidase [Dysgonomonas macrotermitis]